MFPLQFETPDTRAIYFVTLREHAYTVRPTVDALNARHVHARCIDWRVIFASTELPHGTWVLTDFERLSAYELFVAGQVRKALLDQGCQVLNDPSRWRSRADLLQTLHAQGINSFKCWRAASGQSPDRFPVFLRQSSFHQGPKSELLQTPDEAEVALQAALLEGLPLSDLIFVEYAGEQVEDRGYFRKLSAFRVGAEIIRAVSVHDENWIAKDGTINLATAQDYANERAEMDNYPHEDLIWRACDLAGLEFGRVDFGIRAGRPEVWEINSNPTIYPPGDHPNADRAETIKLSFDRIVDELWVLARTPEAPVSIGSCFTRQKQDIEFGQSATTLNSP